MLLAGSMFSVRAVDNLCREKVDDNNVNTWNSLPDSVVLSPSLASFMCKLKFLDFSCM